MTMLDFNDLLEKNNIDPNDVIVLRHSPPEPKVRRILPWLAADRPEIFNAYQQTQVEKLERAMLGAAYLASFIGSASGTAVFVGLYKIGESRPLTREEYWQVPAYIELKKSGMRGFTAEVFAKRKSVLWFDLILTEFCCAWKGKLILSWPGQERSWWRRAHRNEFLIESILQDSALVSGVPSWEDIDLDWSRILLLPSRWKNELSHWRAIYLIFDCSDGKSYVGSAYGKNNLLGRWIEYGVSGHGGNLHLRTRNPDNFRFTILQRLSPDMESDDVIKIENSWKKRLHTIHPVGLNAN